MSESAMYEVCNMDGDQPQVVAGFRRLEDATAYVEVHRGAATFDIRFPDGTWHGKRDTLETCVDEFSRLKKLIAEQESNDS